VYSGRWTHSQRSWILLDFIFCLLCFRDSLLARFPATPAKCLFRVSAQNCLRFVVPKVSDRVDRHGSQSHEAAFESFTSFRNLCLFAAQWRFCRVLRKNRVLYARMKSQRGYETWLLIFRMFCKRESWAQHASTQPPDSGFHRVDGAYNAGSVLLLSGCGGGCTQAVGLTRL
jgi:hypothetical protein